MKDVINEKTFEYFNVDVNLLLIHILLEGFYRGQSTFTLDQFIKGNYWEIEEIKQDMLDTNDYSCAESLAIHQLFHIIEELDLGKIKRVSVSDTDGILESIIRRIAIDKEGTGDDVNHYCAIIDEICNLKKIKEEKIKKEIDTGKKFNTQLLRRVDFTNDEFSKYLDLLLSETPEFIEIEMAPFNNENMKKLNEAVDDFIFNFSQDNYVDQKSIYREKRFYFSKQLENFYEYIEKLPMIEGCINLSFSSLQETGFEVVKILSYLEREKKIKVRNWNDENLWNVKFNITPLSLESITNSRTDNEQPINKEKANENPIKYEQSVLYFKGKEIDFRNKQNQRDLLATLFKEPAKNWSYDEIQETWDDQWEDMKKTNPKEAKNYWKKFYSAGDDINKAVAIETQVKDFIIKNTKEIRINPKHL